MKSEHEIKYEALAQKIGVKALRAILPVPKEVIKKALESGDEHLNSISLSRWDKAAGFISGDNQFHPLWNYPWTKEKANGLSLAERVCVLKHVAKYHLEDSI